MSDRHFAPWLPHLWPRPITRALVVPLALAALVAGCGPSQPPEFRLNLEGRDREAIFPTQTEAITEALQELFGTPDDPTLPRQIAQDLDSLRSAAGPIGRAKVDSGSVGRRGLFRQHCAGCHGVSGDGAGTAALALSPYPRDFRNGLFKYTSTHSGAKPTHADLKRTLVRGISGTAMPSFATLDAADLDSLIDYVRYLGIRGETEQYVVRLVVDEDEYLPLGVDAMDEIVEEGAVWAADSWSMPEQDPKTTVVVPPPEPPIDTPRKLADSIARGRTLYSGKEAQCVKCHGPEGAGDGEETELYDDWNKPKLGVTPEQTRTLATRFTLPIRRLPARDFREGAFRGGKRPRDLYLRIHVGIKGTPMPAAGPAPGVKGALTPEEIWHVVNYIRSLAGQIEHSH